MHLVETVLPILDSDLFLGKGYSVQSSLFMTLGPGSKPQLPVSQKSVRVSKPDTDNYSVSHVQYHIQQITGESTIYYKIGLVLDDLSNCRLNVSILSTFKAGQIKL